MTRKTRTKLIIAGVAVCVLVAGLLVWKPWRMLHWTAQERYAPFTCALYKWGESDQSFSFFAVPRIVSSLARAGEFEKALDFAARSRRHQAHVYADILYYVGTEMEPQLHTQVLFKLFFAALVSGPFVPPEETDDYWHTALPITMLTLAGRLFAQESLPDLARTCFIVAEHRTRLLPPLLQYFHFSEIGFGYIVLGEEKTGQRFLENAEQVATHPAYKTSPCELWRTLGYGAAEAGLQEYLDRYLEKDIAYHKTRGEEIEGFNASLWAKAYMSLRNVDKALELARRDQNGWSRVRDLCDIADIMVDNGDTSGALKLAAEIDSDLMTNTELPHLRVKATARFALLLARLGENTSARTVLVQADKLMESSEFKEWKWNDTAVANVATAWCRIGECQRAFEMLDGADDDENVLDALLDIFIDTYKREYEFTGNELDAMMKLCPEVDL